jgi:hypothetical protein
MLPTLLLSLLLSADPTPPPAGRPGVHGMVLFGAGEHLYLSHIPMFHRPHDMQLLLSVGLEHAQLKPGHAFDDTGYTFEPERFDLDALVSGTLQTFTGTVYRGNFEGGGTPLFRDVRVRVRAVVYSARLNTAGPKAAELGYLAVGTPERLYLVHRISAAPGFDQILVARATGKQTVPGRGEPLTLPRADEEARRLRPGESAKARTARGGELPLEAVRELSLLRGPQFTP